MKFKKGFNKRYCPCLTCLTRAICAVRQANIVCRLLYNYLAPNGIVVPLRYIHVKKILPNLRHVRDEGWSERQGWLSISIWLTITEREKERRRKAGEFVGQFTN